MIDRRTGKRRPSQVGDLCPTDQAVESDLPLRLGRGPEPLSWKWISKRDVGELLVRPSKMRS